MPISQITQRQRSSQWSSRMRTAAAYALVVLGFMSIIGQICGLRQLKGLGFLSGAAPLPIVFSQSRGLPSYAAQFFVEFPSQSGEPLRTHLDKQQYSKILGPLIRRNAYGSVVALGELFQSTPELIQLRNQVLRYGFCRPGGAYVAEMGLPSPKASVRLITEYPNPKLARFAFEIDCP